MKDVLNRIKFDHILSFSILAVLFIALIMFRNNNEISTRIVTAIELAFTGMVAFFFTKHDPSKPQINNTTIIPPKELHPGER